MFRGYKVAYLPRILKMNLLNGLYFPGTGLKRDLFGSLSCLFDKIDFYRITEDDPEDNTNGKKGGWEGRVVLPLGDDQERFMAMVNDIRTHAGEYYESCLASLSSQSRVDRDEASVWQLVASLHGEQGATEEDPALIEKQWQARLVLKLAEIVAEDQVDIDRTLANLSQKGQEVFSNLKGGIDDPEEGADIFEGIYSGSTGASQNPVRARHLLAAWGVLFANDPHHHKFLFTDNDAAASALFNSWEEMSPDPPLLLAELRVPDSGSCLDPDPDWLAMVGAVHALLADDRSADHSGLTTAATQWQQRSEEIDCRALLSLHLLHGASLDKLWQRISGLEVVRCSPGDRLLVGVLRPLS
jgi:hypothetical protein